MWAWTGNWDNDGPTYGRRVIKRWSKPVGLVKHGKEVMYFAESGFLATEGQFENGNMVSQTRWNLDGSINEQCRNGKFMVTGAGGTRTDVAESKRSPPWWWDAKPQERPTAPWWKSDGDIIIHYNDPTLIWLKGQARDNRADGLWTWWDVQGQVKKQLRYRNGERIEEKTSPPWWGDVKDQTP